MVRTPLLLSLRVAARYEVSRTKTTRWAYHVTEKRFLVSIKRKGLVFSKNWPDRVWFAKDPTHYAAQFDSQILLRFPWPSDGREDPTQASSFDPPEFFTKKPVKPELIEALVGGQWKPLVSLQVKRSG